jgi:hypothetical protein
VIKNIHLHGLEFRLEAQGRSAATWKFADALADRVQAWLESQSAETIAVLWAANYQSHDHLTLAALRETPAQQSFFAAAESARKELADELEWVRAPDGAEAMIALTGMSSYE